MAITIPALWRARGGAGAASPDTTSSVGPIVFKRTIECLATDIQCNSRTRFTISRGVDIKEKQFCVPITKAAMSVSFSGYAGDATLVAADMDEVYNFLKANTPTFDGLTYNGLTTGVAALINNLVPQVDQAT